MQSIKEKVYDLSEIPIEHAASLRWMLLAIDQQPLLKLIGAKRKFSRDSLLKVIEQAAADNHIQAVKGRLRDGTIETFVNRVSFPAEFPAFLGKVAAGKAGLSISWLRHILQCRGKRRRTYRQKALHYICSHPVFLSMAEWFCRDPDAYIRLADASWFSPIQIHGEIRSLLDLLAGGKPKDVLEIGTSKGGSLYLFTKVADPCATLVTVDLKIINKKLLQSFTRKQQRIELIEANSTVHGTIARIREIFPEGVDLLFLDGDHSYEGVKKDFEIYSTLVRPGGWIVFHDIVEDNDSRYGVCTGGCSGGVPAFWQEIKKHFRHVEFVDHPEQDGLGIGVLFVPETGIGINK
ncbi:MAG: class I SAM-dependent methyltransferase [bacterium]